MNVILDYIYPPRCPVCDLVSPQGICDNCRKQLIFIGEDFCMKCGKPLTDSRQEYCEDCKKRVHLFEQGRALLSYRGAVRGSLYRFKYGNRREYANVYADEIEKHLGEWIRAKKINLIIPIPLHKRRLRQRGYNQASILAKAIGTRFDIAVNDSLLVRVKKTSPQKNLTGRERGYNLRNAFALRGQMPDEARILLIDDIYTTGSTVDMAAYTLLSGGKCTIYALTIAIGG